MYAVAMISPLAVILAGVGGAGSRITLGGIKVRGAHRARKSRDVIGGEAVIVVRHIYILSHP